MIKGECLIYIHQNLEGSNRKNARKNEIIFEGNGCKLSKRDKRNQSSDP